jgi:hypothetical protein
MLWWRKALIVDQLLFFQGRIEYYRALRRSDPRMEVFANGMIAYYIHQFMIVRGLA